MFLTSTLSLWFVFDLLILYPKDAILLKHVWNTRWREYGEEILRQSRFGTVYQVKCFGASDASKAFIILQLYTNDPFVNLNS